MDFHAYFVFRFGRMIKSQDVGGNNHSLLQKGEDSSDFRSLELLTWVHLTSGGQITDVFSLPSWTFSAVCLLHRSVVTVDRVCVASVYLHVLGGHNHLHGAPTLQTEPGSLNLPLAADSAQ